MNTVAAGGDDSKLVMDECGMGPLLVHPPGQIVRFPKYIRCYQYLKNVELNKCSVLR